MPDTAVRRFFELLQKELGAVDARAELGGRDPVAPEQVFHKLENGVRVVVIFEQPPADRAEVQRKLEQLSVTFSHTLAELPGHFGGRTPSTLPARRLSDAVEALRARTGAVSVVVVDGHSPVLWGSSDAERDLIDVESFAKIGNALNRARERGLTLDQLPLHDASALLAMLPGRGIDRAIIEAISNFVTPEKDESAVRHRLLTALAIAEVRSRMQRGEHVRCVHHESQYGFISRGFANIYSIIVVFAGPFSELHVESAVLHTLPAIEELLFALPPVDPPPGKGQVIRLRPR